MTVNFNNNISTRELRLREKRKKKKMIRLAIIKLLIFILIGALVTYVSFSIAISVYEEHSGFGIAFDFLLVSALLGLILISKGINDFLDFLEKN